MEESKRENIILLFRVSVRTFRISYNDGCDHPFFWEDQNGVTALPESISRSRILWR